MDVREAVDAQGEGVRRLGTPPEGLGGAELRDAVREEVRGAERPVGEEGGVVELQGGGAAAVPSRAGVCKVGRCRLVEGVQGVGDLVWG